MRLVWFVLFGPKNPCNNINTKIHASRSETLIASGIGDYYV